MLSNRCDAQSLSHHYAQILDDHGVVALVGWVGDADDNPLAESFVDTFNTERIKDRVSRTAVRLSSRSSSTSIRNHDPPGSRRR